MNTIFLILIIFGCTLQQVCKKAYNIRGGTGTYSFTAGSALIASVFFVVTSGGDFGFSAQALKYSVAFALCYGVSSLTSMMAIYTGPLALTSLIIQYSLIIPTIYGLVALGESVSLMLILGILLLMISLIFINIESKGEKKKITLKWGIYVFLAFLGNGGCSTVQKIQQIDCDGMYKNEFMIVALVITGIVLMIYGKISEKDRFAINIKKGFFGLLCVVRQMVL